MVSARFRMWIIQLWVVGLLLTLAERPSGAQTTRVIPWNDGDLSEVSASADAYHPEPIIFVHGITSSRLTWEKVIQNLGGATNHWFDAYHYREDERGERGLSGVNSVVCKSSLHSNEKARRSRLDG